MANSEKEKAMEENTKSENNTVESEKPVQVPLDDEVKFPPFPEPTDEDFEKDITEEERNHYINKFKELGSVIHARLHCTACDRHLGCSSQSLTRMRIHPMLRTLMCQSCFTFYNSGEFEKGDDGSELYCRWCGQGGQVYCCSECPHVFCAKCVKRNFGAQMITYIEETDDWKCFKCVPKNLWDLRAICWAAYRYCDLRAKIMQETQDKSLREAYLKEYEIDRSDCCRSKNRRKERTEDKKPKPKEEPKKLNTPPVKPQSIIQVKKFASMNVDEHIIKKVPQKRPASPKYKPIILKNPIAVTGGKVLSPVLIPPMAKKIRISNTPIAPMNYNNDKKSYTRIRPKCTNTPVVFNGYNTGMPMMNNMMASDNINLSLENLTQGLDMAAVAGMSSNMQNNDVVCTPDFPLEPLCEVTEDNNDDDVQCIGPVVESNNPPPLVPRNINPLPQISTDSIIQMTENDVTVNSATGGLKFRVDPQTLSSNKMYRLPDGRVFAINPNPTMPGGYSATIVAVTDDAVLKLPPKGTTYAAKLSSVASPVLSPSSAKICRNQNNRRNNNPKRNNTKHSKINRVPRSPPRECDLNVPVEWYRYNLIDAADALEYSLSRINKIKQEANTMYLRTRTVNEMRNLHKRLESLLSTSICRFNEIRDNLNKEMKQYLIRKLNGNTSEDDDDVEILHDDNDDPIFIDENSVESNVNESQDIDLTAIGSSDHNDSNERSMDRHDGVEILNPSRVAEHQEEENICIVPESGNHVLNNKEKEIQSVDVIDNDTKGCEDEQTTDNTVNNELKDSETRENDVNGENEKINDVTENSMEAVNMDKNQVDEDILNVDNASKPHREKKTDGSDISEEEMMKLLYDENDDKDVKESLLAMDVST